MRSRSRSMRRGRTVSRSRSRRGGFLGNVLNQAIVPFSLVALGQSYKKRGSKMSKTKRRFRK
jgi:hypothetical protein